LYGVPLVSTRRTVQVPTELMVSFSAIVMSPLAGTDVTVQVVTPITGIPRPSDESARVQAPPWSVTMSPARKSMRLVEPTLISAAPALPLTSVVATAISTPYAVIATVGAFLSVGIMKLAGTDAAALFLASSWNEEIATAAVMWLATPLPSPLHFR